jgi:hypothetical protein
MEILDKHAVFLGFGVVSAQSQGPLEPAPSPKPRQNAKNPRSAWLQYFFKRSNPSEREERESAVRMSGFNTTNRV